MPRKAKVLTGEERRRIIEAWAERTDQVVTLADGLEDGIIGMAQIFNTCHVVYDRAGCIQLLMDRDGMTYEEADEFFEYNTQGAYVGETTPAFFTKIEDL